MKPISVFTGKLTSTVGLKAWFWPSVPRIAPLSLPRPALPPVPATGAVEASPGPEW
jgi:hypothetical protein